MSEQFGDTLAATMKSCVEAGGSKALGVKPETLEPSDEVTE